MTSISRTALVLTLGTSNDETAGVRGRVAVEVPESENGAARQEARARIPTDVAGDLRRLLAAILVADYRQNPPEISESARV